MANFTISLHKTLLHEGGYINDPDDRGGETYKGISRNAHKNWKGWKILDSYKYKKEFPKILDTDIELHREIERFYLINYWNPLKADLINHQYVANSIFDFGVNAGIKTSVKLAQSIIEVETDGIIGTLTLGKLNAQDSNNFLTAFTVKKIAYYISIIKNRPANKKFLYGWIIRSLTFSL